MAELNIDKGASVCGDKACWKSIASKGYLFKDKERSQDGVSLLKLLGGLEGKSTVRLKAANNAAKGQLLLPTGLASALAASTAATLRLHSSDGATSCYSATFDTVLKNEDGFFEAKK